MIIALTLIFFLLSPTSAHALSIYNQNIFGHPVNKISSRLETMAKYINQIQPDIVTLQEVFFPSYLKHFPDSYQAYFTQHGPYIRAGLVTLVKKSLTTSNYSFTPFSNQGNIFSLQLTDRLLQKGFQQICIDGSNFCLTNTHLTANYFGSTNYTTQLSQTKHILSSPTNLLIGDFNFPTNSNPFNLVTLHLSLVTSHSLDHAFTSLPLASSSSHIINLSPPVSDHSGFFLTFP